MKLQHLIIFFVLISGSLSAESGARPDGDASSNGFDEALSRADTIIYGAIIGSGADECGSNSGVGYTDFRVLKVIRGKLLTKENVVRVCASARLVPAGLYLVAGKMDKAGVLLPEWNGFVLQYGSCSEYFQVDFNMDPYVTGSDGQRYFAVGKMLPDFAKRYGPRLDFNFGEFESGTSEYLCGISAAE